MIISHPCRARTASRDPRRRLLFITVSFILINTRVYVVWESVSVPVGGRHGRRVIEELLPYMTVLMMVGTAVNRIYGVATMIVLSERVSAPAPLSLPSHAKRSNR